MLSMVLVKVEDWARFGRPGAAARAPISRRFPADFAAYSLRYSAGLTRSNFLNGVKMM